MEDKIFKRKARRLKAMINSLEKTLKEIAAEMADVIDASEELSRQMKLLKSVEGVGSVVAMNMIIATEAFTRFDNPRQFNCYVGVAPFAYTSGTSQHSRNRVSQRAVKYIKCLLHMAAVAIAHKKTGDMKHILKEKSPKEKQNDRIKRCASQARGENVRRNQK